MRHAWVSSSNWLSRVARETPKRSSARTKSGMTSETVSANGGGVGRSCRSRSMAAFESKARGSNFKLVSPECLPHGARKRAAVFITERSCEFEPRLIAAGRDLPDLDLDLLVIADTTQRLGELEDVLFGHVLCFHRSAHLNRITV